MRRLIPAKEWFQVGDRYQIAALLLDEHDIVLWNVAEPHWLLHGFSSECYLKCLLKVEGKDPEAVHNLKTLFDRLEPNSRKCIKRWWDRSSLSHLDKFGAQAREHFPELKLPKTFGQALDFSKNAVEHMRYFETGGCGWLLYFFGLCVRTRILELNPNWVPDADSPSATLNAHTQLIESKKERFDFITSKSSEADRKAAAIDS